MSPTLPNSPREITLGEVAPNEPIHTDMASKSNERQTEIFLAMVVSIGVQQSALSFQLFPCPPSLSCKDYLSSGHLKSGNSLFFLTADS